VFSYASPRLCDKDKEHFIRKQQFSDTGNAWRFEYMIILLDSKNKVIKDEKNKAWNKEEIEKNKAWNKEEIEKNKAWNKEEIVSIGTVGYV